MIPEGGMSSRTWQACGCTWNSELQTSSCLYLLAITSLYYNKSTDCYVTTSVTGLEIVNINFQSPFKVWSPSKEKASIFFCWWSSSSLCKFIQFCQFRMFFFFFLTHCLLFIYRALIEMMKCQHTVRVQVRELMECFKKGKDEKVKLIDPKLVAISSKFYLLTLLI